MICLAITVILPKRETYVLSFTGMMIVFLSLIDFVFIVVHLLNLTEHFRIIIIVAMLIVQLRSTDSMSMTVFSRSVPIFFVEIAAEQIRTIGLCKIMYECNRI